MDEIIVKITKEKIIIWEKGMEYTLNEASFPEMRKIYPEGLYDAFIDRNEIPYKIKFMKEYSKLSKK